MNISNIEQLHRKYAPNDKVYDLVYGHCQIVCEIALWCADNIKLDSEVDADLLQSAALLHDIGTYILFDNDGKVSNERMYPQHAILGAKIVADEGIDMKISKMIETHILLGLTKQEIIDTPWILPARDYRPDTIEGELLCYADRFHSKHPTFNAYDTFLNKLKSNLPLQAAKFETWSKRFGIPDIESLADKYNQTVR
jgi:uncharacterized protein